MMTRTPYPVPKRRKRVRSEILRAPKRIWLRHRKSVRGHYCCVPGCQFALVDVAHLRSVVDAGTSLKPHDWFIVPLCRHHHMEEEPLGPDAFGDRHGIDLWAIAAELVRKSPDTAMKLAMLEAGLGHDGQPIAAAKPLFPKPVHVKHRSAIPIVGINLPRVRMIEVMAGLPRYLPILGRVR